MKIRSKLIMIFATILVMYSLILVGIVKLNEDNAARVQLTNSIVSSSNFGQMLLDKTWPGEWKKIDGKLYKGSTLVNDNFELIDMIKKSTGISCTIFLGDLRISTNVLKNDGTRAVGTKAVPEVTEKVINKGNEFIGEAIVVDKPFVTSYKPIKDSSGKVIGMWFTGIDKSNVTILATQNMKIIMISIILILVFALLISSIFGNKIGMSIEELNKTLGNLALGNYKTEISKNNLERKDEVGHMAKAIIRLAGNFKNIKDEIQGKLNTLNTVLLKVKKAESNIAAFANDMAITSQTLSQSATEQASMVEEINTSVQEMANQSKENEANAINTNKLAYEAKENADIGSKKMNNMVSAMNEINQSSYSISKIIKVIDEIAFQTNILALNASVEAARAGVYGKGFAVVAEEVRNLAGKSTQAAKETADMIEESIKKVETGTIMVKETFESLNKIIEKIEIIAFTTNNITQASSNQVTAILQIGKAMLQIAQSTQITSATAEQSASMSEELAVQVELLKEIVDSYKAEAIGV